MNRKSYIGNLGEDIASAYLRNKGYKIIERNARKKWGELDIITRSPDNVLVFAEVKTLVQGVTANTVLKPEDNLTAAKLKKLQKTAQLYSGKHSELINEDRGWRIDLIAISLPSEKISHYENI